MNSFPQIHLAQITDAPEVGQLFRAATKAMQARGIDQWNEHYPLEKEAAADIAKNCLYKYMVDRSIAGAITLNAEQEESYKSIDWKDENGKALIVHRIAVHPHFQHKGIAKNLMYFSEKFGLSEGYTSIRLDTYSRNDYSLSMYAKLGYEQKAGTISFPGRKYRFYCFEKMLGDFNKAI